MSTVIIVTAVLHVLSGVFWAGTTFVLARTAGAQTGPLFRPQMGAAAIAVGTGGLLWYLLHRESGGTQEHVLGLGAIFALVAAGVQGITARGRRAEAGQRVAAGLLAVTLACMAASRYV
jgi:hypothetical protein